MMQFYGLCRTNQVLGTEASVPNRLDELIHRFTGGDPEILAGLRKLYADQPNWPATFQKPYKDDHAAFVNQARAHREG
jgi:hypothetical protein